MAAIFQRVLGRAVNFLKWPFFKPDPPKPIETILLLLNLSVLDFVLSLCRLFTVVAQVEL